MPKCKNAPHKSYTGYENTPLGRGYSASVEELGKKRKGKDGNMYMVVKGGRWKKIVDERKKRNPKMYWNVYLPDELIEEIAKDLECEEILRTRQISPEDKEFIDSKIFLLYEIWSRKDPENFPPDYDFGDSEGEELVRKVLRMCQERKYRNIFLDNSPDSTQGLNPEQQVYAGMFFSKGVDAQYAYLGAKNLNNNQRENMKILLEAGLPTLRTASMWAYEGAKDFDEEGVDDMIELINEGAIINNAYNAVKFLTKKERGNMISLLKNGLSSENAYDSAKLEDKRIRAVTTLRNYGATPTDAYSAISNLNDPQLRYMVQSLKNGTSSREAYKDSRRQKLSNVKI